MLLIYNKIVKYKGGRGADGSLAKTGLSSKTTTESTEVNWSQSKSMSHSV